ncbi:MAG: type II secretion system protein [Candidatus Omnitrophota bacterium]
MSLKFGYIFKKAPLKIKKSLAGFTLVEIVVAAMILSIAIWSIMVAFNAGTRFVYHSRYRLLAVNYMQAVLENLRQAVREDTWGTGDLSFGNHNCPFANPLATIDPAATCTYTVTDFQGGNNPDLPKNVEVTVTWTPP